MKQLLITIVCALAVQMACAEVYRFEAYSVSTREVGNNGEWQEWTDWTDAETTITIDTDRDKVTVYLDNLLSFDIYESDRFGDDGNGGQVVQFDCVDDEGLKSGIRVRSNEDGLQIYFDYGNFSAVFNVKTRDNMSTLFPSKSEYERYQLNKLFAAAEQGDALAIYSLGLAYDTGDNGLARDTYKAKQYYERLKNMGVYLGYNQLAYIAAREGNYTQAHSLIDQAISRFNSNGRSRYVWDWDLNSLLDTKGDIYLMQNRYQEALPIYRRLLNSGDADAQNTEFMRKMKKYMSGEGVFSYSPTSLSFGFQSSTQRLNVSTSAKWRYECPDWVTMNWVSSDGYFQVSCQSNNSRNSRSGYIKLIATEINVTKLIPISQNGNPNSAQSQAYTDFWVEKDYYYVSSAGGYFNINIYGESYVRLTGARTNSNWLEEENIAHGGKQFHVKKNLSSNSRTAYLYIYDNRGRTLIVKVTQQGK